MAYLRTSQYIPWHDLMQATSSDISYFVATFAVILVENRLLS